MQFAQQLTALDPSQGEGSEVWPLNDYRVKIVKEEVKPVVGKPNNSMLVYTLHCIEGTHAGKTHTYRFNLVNDNAQAVEIAYRQLAALSAVCGRWGATDTAHLVNSEPFIARIGPQPDNPEKYSEVNRVKFLDGTEPGPIDPTTKHPTRVPGKSPAQQLPKAKSGAATGDWTPGASVVTNGPTPGWAPQAAAVPVAAPVAAPVATPSPVTVQAPVQTQWNAQPPAQVVQQPAVSAQPAWSVPSA